MFKILLARLQQGHRTMKYPDGPAARDCRIDFAAARSSMQPSAPTGCRACAEACPTGAITVTEQVQHRPGQVPVLHGLRGSLSRAGHRLLNRLPPGGPTARGPDRRQDRQALQLAAAARRQDCKSSSAAR